MTKVGWVEYQRRRLAGEEKNIPWFVGDKLRAYEFARSVGVETPQVYATFERPEQFTAAAAPELFVCKPLGMHSTQGVMILRKRPDGTFFDSLRKRTLTADAIVAEQTKLYETNKWKKSYRLVLEERLVGEDGNADAIPFDYKHYCFGPRIELVTQIDRNSRPPHFSWFRREFEPLDLDLALESDWAMIKPGIPVKPSCHDGLVRAARTVSIALKTPFVSVDLYATNRGPVLGEITLAPGGPYYGKHYRFKPHFDELLGDLWEKAAGDIAAASPPNSNAPAT